ncbi:hypothetical protein ETAA8_57830 [Anatilimnocola aggregata]|uniref:Uncharacterized protein n=1 Tax=Anatilimnocola aggregata TaxID=2528021 RepID=A0A517YKA3_9BACT|nr:DUF1016 domain-containing protein [Anatilimnocola aggregata]QDU30637.1 hypothetical protein ETAA8_57830 [Anatilimnocola aggregata]
MTQRDQIRAIRQDVLRVHLLGAHAVAKIKKAGGKYSAGAVARIAAEGGVSEPSLRKAIKFYQTYSTEELKEFQRLRTPSGSPLSISVAYQIMYVANRQRRTSIARRAAESGWSIRDVEAEVRRRVGLRELARKGGRIPRLPTNSDEALRQLAEKCDQWNRWVGHLDVARESGAFSAAQLPENLRKRVDEVTLAMQKLAGEVAKVQSGGRRNS